MHSSVSLFRCFLEKNLYLSKVRFRCFLNICSQLSLISVSFAVEMTMYECRSVKFFRPADPKDKHRILTIFRSAACSFMLLISAVCLGLFSVGALNNSCTDIECFALTATTNTSHHFSNSVLMIRLCPRMLAIPPKLTDCSKLLLRSSPYCLAAPCYSLSMTSQRRIILSNTVFWIRPCCKWFALE